MVEEPSSTNIITANLLLSKLDNQLGILITHRGEKEVLITHRGEKEVFFIVLSEQESSCPEGVLFEKTPGFTELSLFMEL
ncbi:hypothetical protein GGP51_003293, partial [Salinibacter ruber]|nr:hypothetical protein [Salinibacter ruber]